MKWLGIALMVAGFALSAWSVFDYFRVVARARRASAWPAVPGEIVESGIRAEAFQSEGATSYVYHPEVRYRYQAGGRPREGTRMSFDMVKSGLRRRAERRLAPYPVGAAVQVRHDPADPGESVLDPARPRLGPHFLGGCAGLAVALVGMLTAA